MCWCAPLYHWEYVFDECSELEEEEKKLLIDKVRAGIGNFVDDLEGCATPLLSKISRDFIEHVKQSPCCDKTSFSW